jgi:hypothetical protein
MRLPVWLSVITLHATLYGKRRVKGEGPTERGGSWEAEKGVK